MAYKLGSLFDGSGGFPLAGCLCGIEPKWAAEVEPYPIAVTRARFPGMKHLGDIRKVHGGEIEPVDIITFGSPCQDMSVAGKRAGIKHEANGDEETTRSGLFMEAVRIIKEMREATNGEYPTFALWENVPGAFSSNKGEDFRTVLEELIKIVEPSAVMPAVPKGGWPYADSYCGDGWSLAYRVFDAQYWGVPQRRRRIHLIVDFRGQCAREVLFERKGVRGYFETGRAPWQGPSGDTQDCSGADDRAGESPEAGGGRLDAVAYTLKIRSGCEGGGKGELVQTDKSATLATNNDKYLFQPVPNLLLDDQGGHQVNVRTDGKAPTLRAETHGNLPCVLESAGFKAGNSMAGSIGWQEECSATLAAQCSGTEPTVCLKCYNARGYGDGETVSTLTGDHENRITDYTSLVCEPVPIHDQATRFHGKRGGKSDGKGNGLGVGESGDPMNTLTAGDRHAVAYTMQGFGDYKESEVLSSLKARDYKDATDLVSVCGIDCRNMDEYPELYPTLQAKPNGGQSLNFSGVVRVRYIVRRLTPTECARLQGFADRWGDIDKKDRFTPEEYRFWLEARNTHATINGKQVKDYTEKQMLTWYNKLHTDSAEYKMWGNGIALPPALYCMQGIKDALERGDEDDAGKCDEDK